jgi:fucose permease
LEQENRASALNLLNFSWTVGAVGAPMVIAWLLKPIGLRGLMLLLASCCAVIALIEAAGIRSSTVQIVAERLPGKISPNLRGWFAVLTTTMLILYVGVENGFAGWLPLFTMRMQHGSSTLAAWVQSGFWVAILLGRLAAALIVKRTSTRELVLSGLLLGMIGIAITILAQGVLTLMLGVILAGLGLSAVFPTVVAIFTEEYGTGGGGSIVLGLCGLGGALIPWLVGVVSFESNSLRLGLAVTLFAIVLSLLVFWKMQSLVKVGRVNI